MSGRDAHVVHQIVRTVSSRSGKWSEIRHTHGYITSMKKSSSSVLVGSRASRRGGLHSEWKVVSSCHEICCVASENHVPWKHCEEIRSKFLEIVVTKESLEFCGDQMGRKAQRTCMQMARPMKSSRNRAEAESRALEMVFAVNVIENAEMHDMEVENHQRIGRLFRMMVVVFRGRL